MSLVVAYKRDGIIYMGADTQSSRGYSIERTLNESGFKISRLSSGMLMGVCGRVKGHQRILSKKCFDIPDDVVFNKRYIVKNIIPQLSDIMKDVVDENESRNSSMSVSLIVAWQGKMFMITSRFKVLECASYAAIGAGNDYAGYLLSSIGKSDDVNEGLLKALRAGANFDSSVSAPFVLIDTKDREYKIIEG